MKKTITICIALLLGLSMIGCTTKQQVELGSDISKETKETVKEQSTTARVAYDPKKEKAIAEEKKRAELYAAAMQAAFKEENGGDKFVAVKLDALEDLSNQAKEELMNKLTNLSPNVYKFQDIKNDNSKFKLDDKGRVVQSLNGTLLWVEVEEYNGNKAIITGVSWFGNLGAIFPKYEATFENGQWKLKKISMAIS